MTWDSGILHEGWGGQMLFVQHFAYAHLITHVADVTALRGATSDLPEGGPFNGTATYVYTFNIRSVKNTTQEYVRWYHIVIYIKYIQKNCMFRPCKRAIFRLFLEPVI
jgi:hypothetical protein